MKKCIAHTVLTTKLLVHPERLRRYGHVYDDMDNITYTVLTTKLFGRPERLRRYVRVEYSLQNFICESERL